MAPFIFAGKDKPMAIEDLMNKEIGRLEGETKPKRAPLKKATGLVENKSPLKKLKDTFFEEDFGTVAESLKRDIVVPQIKSFFANLFIGGIERAFYGTKSRPSGPATNYGSSLVRTYTQPTQYTNYSKPQTRENPGTKIKQKFNLGDLIFRDYPSAKDLLDSLRDEIDHHDSVTVAQLYEAISTDDDYKDIDFTNNYYGWKNLDNAQIVSVYAGYQLVLPKPIQLD